MKLLECPEKMRYLPNRRVMETLEVTSLERGEIG